LIKYGVIDVDTDLPMLERMKIMYEEIEKLILQEHPSYLAIENTQFQGNYSTYQSLSQIQGLIMSIVFKLDMPFLIISPSEWRSTCLIKGRKRVEQKQGALDFVKLKFNIITGEDTAEAICLGYHVVKGQEKWGN
jgi:Holliday junction resolvasome RuvABC endonuclease subunit